MNHERTTNPKRTKNIPPSRNYRFSKSWERTGNGIQVAEKYQIHPQNPLSVEKGSGVRGALTSIRSVVSLSQHRLSNGLAAPHTCPSEHFAHPHPVRCHFTLEDSKT
jgi:hypothetical protein